MSDVKADTEFSATLRELARNAARAPGRETRNQRASARRWVFGELASRSKARLVELADGDQVTLQSPHRRSKMFLGLLLATTSGLACYAAIFALADLIAG